MNDCSLRGSSDLGGRRQHASSIVVTVQIQSPTFVTEATEVVRKGRGCTGEISAPVSRQHPPWSS
jgi:hypothetical protein